MDAREGKGNFSYNDSKSISEKVALTEMTNYKFHTLGDNTLVEGLRKKVMILKRCFMQIKAVMQRLRH